MLRVFAAVTRRAAAPRRNGGLLYERSLPALILAVSATSHALALWFITLRALRESEHGGGSHEEGIGGNTTLPPNGPRQNTAEWR